MGDHATAQLRLDRWTAAALLAALLAIGAGILAAVDGKVVQALTVTGVGLPSTLLGIRILVQQPDNRVARRLVLVGLSLSWLLACAVVEEHVVVELGRPDALVGRVASLLDNATFMLALGALAGVLAVFPDGRAASPRLARIDSVAGPALVAVYLAGLFSGDDLGVESRPSLQIVSPLPVIEPLGFVMWLGILALFAWLITCAWSVRRRHRDAAGIERLQLSWLVYGAMTVPLTIALCFADPVLTGNDEGILTLVALLSASVAIPACVSVAILRHRLYDIDRLVNRTLVYAVLTVLLGAVYAAIVLGAGVAVGGGGAWATAAATLAVATGFRPARTRVQREVDRRFARRRFLGLQAVGAFLEDVRAGRDEPERLAAVLAEALGDDGLEVWFRLPASEAWADGEGRIAELPQDTVRMRTPVRRGDLDLGVVLHDPRLAETPDTLDSVVRAAGLAMEIARLRVEVRVQLAEVQTAQARLAVAAEAERRKLERDLHDGAQQRLVALGLALRHAQHQLRDSPDSAIGTLDAAVAEVATAVAELRAIARGLRPSLLEAGLGPALDDVARRAPLPVVVEVAPGKLAPDVEATVFYLACEGLTNVVKHAGARHARIRVHTTGAGTRVEIADDGDGGATATSGGGIDGMLARVAQHGGTLEVESPPGGGTRVIAELPGGS